MFKASQLYTNFRKLKNANFSRNLWKKSILVKIVEKSWKLISQSLCLENLYSIEIFKILSKILILLKMFKKFQKNCILVNFFEKSRF